MLHDPGDERVAAVAHGVDLHLLAAQVLVDENPAGSRLERRVEVALEILGAVRDLHAPPAEHVRGTHEHRIADLARDGERLGERLRGPAGRLGDAERVGEVVEAAAILGERDRVRAGAGDLSTDAGDAVGEVERGLPAELNDGRKGLRPLRLPRSLVRDDAGDRLLVERLEVEPRGCVEIRGHGLGIAVHHDRRDATLLERTRRLDAAAIELDPLSDADGPGAQDEDLLSGEGLGLVLLLVRRIEVRRHRLELGGARVDHLVDGSDPPLRAKLADVRREHPGQRRDVGIREAETLCVAKQRGRRRPALQLALGEADQRGHLPQEPAIDVRSLVDALDRGAATERRQKAPQPIVGRRAREEAVDERVRRDDVDPGPVLPEHALAFHLEGAERLL